MAEWYGGENKYGITRGSIIDMGPHRVMCGNTLSDDFNRLFENRKIDCVYTDPPWDTKIATAFWKNAGYEGRVEIDLFLDSMTKNFAKVFRDMPLYIEFGNKEVATLKNYLDKEGAVLQRAITTFYGAGTPMTVLNVFFGSCDVDFFIPDGLKGGMKVPKLIMEGMAAHGKKHLAEPFVGKGDFFKIAINNGFTCTGMELNPNKLALLVEWADKKGFDISIKQIID